MTEKLAIISDIHGNSPALKAVLEDIERAGCSKIIFLGDIVNGLDPQTCVQIIRGQENVFCLKGNAEFYILTPDLDEFPRKNEPMYRDLIPLLQWIRSKLSTEEVEWIQGLPNLLIQDGICFVHDSPLDRLFVDRKSIAGIEEKYRELCYHSKGISPELQFKEWESLLHWMKAQSISIVFCGHTHLSFYREAGQYKVCNVGSVGLPLDGDPRPAWVLLENSPEGEQVITIRRVDYDIQQILQMVVRIQDYPDFKNPEGRMAYQQTLLTGRMSK